MSVEPDHRKFRPQKPRFFCCHLNHVYTGAVMKALCAMLPEETEEQARKMVNEQLERLNMDNDFKIDFIHEIFMEQ